MSRVAFKHGCPSDCTVGSVWAVPLYRLHDEVELLPAPRAWAVCIISHVTTGALRSRCRVVLHGFGPMRKERPASFSAADLASTPRLSAVMSVRHLSRHQFSCIGEDKHHRLVSNAMPRFVAFDEDTNGWTRQLMDPKSLDDLGPGRSISSAQSRGGVLGGICDPLWFSYNLHEAIRLKWRGKPPLKWYRRLVRAGLR